MERIMIAVAWTVGIFFILWSAVGFVAGLKMGITDPDNAPARIQELTQELLTSYGIPILLLAVLLAGLGTWFQVLPGTRSKD